MILRCQVLSVGRRVVLGLSLAPFLVGCAAALGRSSEQGDASPPLLPRVSFRETVAPGQLVGVVLDAHSGQPIDVAQATVTLSALRRQARTNERGVFRIDGLSPGTYVLRVIRIGYDARSDTLTVVAGAGVSAVVQMKRASVRLQSVIIVHAPTRP